jgi:hypothetical protein
MLQEVIPHRALSIPDSPAVIGRSAIYIVEKDGRR